MHDLNFTRYFPMLADASVQFAVKSMHFIDLIRTYSSVFHYFA